MLRTLVAAVLLSLTADVSSAGAQPDLVENFEKADLNPHLWSKARLPLQRAWIHAGDSREGASSLAIRVKGSDLDKNCSCQRIEVREPEAAAAGP